MTISVRFGRLGDLVRTLGDDNPGAPLLTVEGVSLSRSGFLKAAEERAAQFDALGLAPGGRAVIMGGRGANYLIDMAAVWLCDAAAVPLDPGGNEAQRADIITRVRPALMIGEEVKAISSNRDERSEGFASILFTSGSTGRSKGVLLSHRALLGNVGAVLKILPLGAGDRLGVAVPFHFTSAICHFLACLQSGAEFAGTERKLMPIDLVAFLEDGCTCFGGAPIQLSWIQMAASTRPLTNLRWVMSSGDYLPADTIKGFHEHLPSCGVYTFYGLTEVGGRFCVLSAERAHEGMGTVGKPIEGLHLEIRNDVGETCAPGDTGEVWVGGEWLLDEYFDDPDVTAAPIKNGYFRTGDLGFLTQLGDLTLVGRSDDVFKVGGQKVSAIHIEKELSCGDFFKDVAVVPVMQADGLKPFVFFVPKDSGFDRSLVMQYLRGKLPSTHMPHKFIEVPEIPRSGAGKVRRSVLRSLVGRA